MVQYDIKRGWFKNIEGPGLETLMKESFGKVEKRGNVYVSSYSVLSKIEVELIDKTLIRMETESRTGPKTDADILDSKRKLNAFVEKATGFDAKARMKRAQQKAKAGEA